MKAQKWQILRPEPLLHPPTLDLSLMLCFYKISRSYSRLQIPAPDSRPADLIGFGQACPPLTAGNGPKDKIRLRS
jgi:hypothetical protein